MRVPVDVEGLLKVRIAINPIESVQVPKQCSLAAACVSFDLILIRMNVQICLEAGTCNQSTTLVDHNHPRNSAACHVARATLAGPMTAHVRRATRRCNMVARPCVAFNGNRSRDVIILLPPRLWGWR